jgi:hypothetical protein
VVRGKTVSGRTFAIRRLKSSQSPDNCQILFIAGSEKPRLKPTLERLHTQPVLTVADLPGFCESGGHINLSVVESKVKLEINPDAAAKDGLQISSRLLSLARIVHTATALGAKN